MRRRVLRQLAVAELAARRLVDDFVVAASHLGRIDAPALGGGPLQHHARGGAAFAHRLHEVPRAARAVGVLVAVFLLVAGRLDDADARPVGLELVGDDHAAGRRATPGPISERWQTMVTVPSLAIETKTRDR